MMKHIYFPHKVGIMHFHFDMNRNQRTGLHHLYVNQQPVCASILLLLLLQLLLFLHLFLSFLCCIKKNCNSFMLSTVMTYYVVKDNTYNRHIRTIHTMETMVTISSDTVPIIIYGNKM